VEGKLKEFNTADLIPFKASKICVVTVAFLDEEGKIIQKLTVLLNWWKGQARGEAGSYFYV